LSGAWQLVTDGSWLYWTDIGNVVKRARLDGSQMQSLFQGDNEVLLGVAQGYLWWRDGGSGLVGRARLDGSQIERAYLTGAPMYAGYLAPPWLYYTGSSCGGGCIAVDGSIKRIALEPGASPEFIQQREPGTAYSIAVDSRGAQFSVLGIRRHRDGTATARVSTPRPADVSVRGKRIVSQTARDPELQVAGDPDPKLARVAIRPRGTAVRALRRNGTARVGVRIKVHPAGGLPRKYNRTVILRVGPRR
jgi:hypothetical protein